MPSTCRLITIPFSHYCEKARWALDFAGVPYVEEAYLPGMHMRPARKAGGRTVPVLVTPDRPLTDSADIVSYADSVAAPGRKLYPSDPAAHAEVSRLEARFNGPLGVSTRVVAYFHALPNPRALAEFARPGLSRVQAFLLPYAVPFVRPRITRMYGVGEAQAAEALETTRAVFAEAGTALGSREWLVGDRMTAADIAFASLAAPLLGPEGHPTTRVVLDMVPASLRAIIEELRATPAGAHALRLYRGHRGRRSIR